MRYNPELINKGRHEEEREVVSWNEVKEANKVEADRIRFVTDRSPYCPVIEMSYCHLFLDGKKVNVRGGLPFETLPKREWKTEIVKRLKAENVFIINLFGGISIDSM